MEKRKRWQKLLVLMVTCLTIYNILPTVFFYSKPLNQSIDEKAAQKISTQIMGRINHLEVDAKNWLDSFCHLLKIKPQSITIDNQNPKHISLTFKNLNEANLFRKQLPRAGSLIPFVPSQLSLFETEGQISKTVTVQRKIPLRFQNKDQDKYFQFSKKFDENGNPTPLYRALVFDRLVNLGSTIGGASENAKIIEAVNALGLSKPQEKKQLILNLAHNTLSFVNVFGESSAISKRYFSTFSQIGQDNKTAFIQNFIDTAETTKDQIKLSRIDLQSEGQSLQARGSFLDTEKQQQLEQLLKQEKTLLEFVSLLKKEKNSFASGSAPWTPSFLGVLLEESAEIAQKNNSGVQTLHLNERNPFISEIILDWSNETIELALHSDLLNFKTELAARNQHFQKDQIDQQIYNEIAQNSRKSSEKIIPSGNTFQVKLNKLEGSDSFLAMRLSQIAKARASELREVLTTHWNPKHPELKRSDFPIWDYETYQSLPAHEKKLGLLIYAPSVYSKTPDDGFKTSSIYVIAKGLDKIIQKIQQSPNSRESQSFFKDFNTLRDLLKQNGLFGYPGNTLAINKDYANDFIFEAEDFYLPVIKASREEFAIHGTKRFATLEFTDTKQRILTHNKIENQLHEDLLKWRDDYYNARLGLGGVSNYDVPKPTKNILFDNLRLSLNKYFNGDDRKILNWGLDLSGGKTVQIELRDQTGRIVTDDEDIKQGINELYARVNKMGVSEVSIRREGNFITLDFPGSQGLSANELIKASTMYFHIVNEKFNTKNPKLADASNQFLQDIWNEAVVTGKKTGEEINKIAWRHIHGDSFDPEVIQPRSEAARTLYENGLRLSPPNEYGANNLFNDTLSQVALWRGDDFAQWHGQTHPLIIVFRSFALEGANLKEVQSGYDPSKGNFLSFGIKGKETLNSGEKINPRDDLHAWTSQFSKDKLAGTPNAVFSQNEGWRMAVILNGTVITAPTLTSAIRDGGTIEGGFTQREMNKLEADLKAGSLSFTPRILSEKNVSPELGSQERLFGILATLIALVLVILAMVGYYRFGGMIASVAVVFNLLIMWATLQNLDATLTLASIAGAILTLGMAVDANVLVFERIREEFSKNQRLAPAIQSGYRKAFSAIFDSNVTTIIAALILLQFDSGPIKGFAVTLIIGIVSSMFTALFLTRYFFTGWVKNPKNTSLKMAQFIKATKFNFLKYSKFAIALSTLIILVGGYMFIGQKNSIMGMDFTGGYCLNVDLKPKNDFDYRSAIENALVKGGANQQDFQVRQLTPNNQLRIFLSKGMQQEGKPFFGMPMQTDLKQYSYLFETNPRIMWVMNSLESDGLILSPDSLKTLDQNWSEVSGQLSDSMRNNALMGLAIATLCILLYITFRFEFKFAISATLCLLHDVGITLACIAILHAFGIAVQIDLNIVAALMTIVGYSLNDTIIIFDRIREDSKAMRKATFTEIINHALNVTLSRTTITSGTTLLVLLPLLLLGGSTIFGFALVMVVGVIFGTLSSLFVAAPILNFFHARQTEKKKKAEVQIVN